MQVSATLIAAQQAAREARTRLQLEKTTGVSGAFAPLPLKQTAPMVQTAAPQPQQANAAPGRMGQHVNILV
jgi:Flp pilus assembly protein TadG